MTRTPLHLAALASVAVPGLDPVAAGAFPVDPGSAIDAALVKDATERTWLVRASASPAASVALDAGAAAAALVAKRLPVPVPVTAGTVRLPEGGRAHVHRAIPGRGLRLSALQPDFPIATTLGELIAVIHNLDNALFEDAGLESYTSDEYRQRRLTDLDRAAGTGRVPAGLLTRWEGALEHVALWQWVPVPVHGGLEGRHVLVALGDDGAAHVTGVVGWRRAKVADPADDFAALVAQAEPPAVIAVAKAYARARATRPDRHMLTRAQLVAELAYVNDLFDALAAGYPDLVDAATARLRELEEDVADTELIPSAHPRAGASAPADESARSAESGPRGGDSPGGDSPGEEPSGGDSPGGSSPGEDTHVQGRESQDGLAGGNPRT